jgi:hypothetical protein
MAQWQLYGAAGVSEVVVHDACSTVTPGCCFTPTQRSGSQQQTGLNSSARMPGNLLQQLSLGII